MHDSRRAAGSASSCESVPGKGSMFAIRVPLAERSGATMPRPFINTARAIAGALRGVFAIVVDDDEHARACMQGLLERWYVSRSRRAARRRRSACSHRTTVGQTSLSATIT